MSQAVFPVWCCFTNVAQRCPGPLAWSRPHLYYPMRRGPAAPPGRWGKSRPSPRKLRCSPPRGEAHRASRSALPSLRLGPGPEFPRGDTACPGELTRAPGSNTSGPTRVQPDRPGRSAGFSACPLAFPSTFLSKLAPVRSVTHHLPPALPVAQCPQYKGMANRACLLSCWEG